MQYFTADPRDGGSRTGCAVCCCQTASGMPGETNKWSINYAPWSVPLGGRGLTVNNVYEITPLIETNGQFALVLFKPVETLVNTAIETEEIPTNFEGNVSFEVLPTYEPQHGTLEIFSNEFDYTPNTNFTGQDSFFYKATSPDGDVEIGEIQIGVGADSKREPTPFINVKKNKGNINTAFHTVDFPIEFSPAAPVGNVYRLTVRQQAMDCDNYYWHTMCIDITIGKC